MNYEYKTCTSFGAEKGRQQPSVLHRLRKRLAHACFSEFLGSYLRQFPRCFTLHLQQFVPRSRPFSGRLCWCQMELSSPVLHTLLTKQSHVILRHRRCSWCNNSSLWFGQKLSEDALILAIDIQLNRAVARRDSSIYSHKFNTLIIVTSHTQKRKANKLLSDVLTNELPPRCCWVKCDAVEQL